MDPTYTLKPQLRIKTQIYILMKQLHSYSTEYIQFTNALLCYDDVQLYDKLYKMYHDNHQHIH